VWVRPFSAGSGLPNLRERDICANADADSNSDCNSRTDTNTVTRGLFGDQQFVWHHCRGHPADGLHGQPDPSRKWGSRKRFHGERDSGKRSYLIKWRHDDNLPFQRLTRGRGPQHNAYSSLCILLRRPRRVCVRIHLHVHLRAIYAYTNPDCHCNDYFNTDADTNAAANGNAQ
jgi:hypothetical protein